MGIYKATNSLITLVKISPDLWLGGNGINTMIYNEIRHGAFSHWLAQSDNYKDNFSYEGANALQEYLEDMSNDWGENIEFDPVAWCCEFSEYASAWDAMKQYQPEDMPVEGVEGDDLVEIQEKNEAGALRWLQDNTTVIEFDGGIIVQDF